MLVSLNAKKWVHGQTTAFVMCGVRNSGNRLGSSNSSSPNNKICGHFERRNSFNIIFANTAHTALQFKVNAKLLQTFFNKLNKFLRSTRKNIVTTLNNGDFKIFPGAPQKLVQL